MVAGGHDNPTSSAAELEADRTRDLPKEKLPASYRRAVPANFPPKEFDRYKFVRELGRGSMGQVYVYRETGAIDREVAIKFQRDSDRESASRFHTEARIAASLQHPNVVTVFADGEYNGIPYIVFEYLDGESLDKLKEPMPWTEVRKLGLQLASGLAAVHSAGLLHRDIKPANSMLLDRGGQQLVKLIDFGVAKSSDAARNLGGSTGTPRYMAPEVWDSGRPTERSDVYSLGLTLYQLCTGVKPPVHPYDEDVRLERPDIDSAFASVVNRCLEREPHKRYASGSELYNALLPLYSVRELMDIDVQQWLRNDRADAYLWTGRKLERAADLDLESLPENPREFLIQARKRARSASWRKRALAVMMLLSIVAVYVIVRFVNQAALDRRVDSHMRKARDHLDLALVAHADFDTKRDAALAEFADQGDTEPASTLWHEALRLEPDVDKKYRAVGQELESAFALDPSRADVRKMLARVLSARAKLADDTLRERERSEYLERLQVYDSAQYEHWTLPADVTLGTDPAGAQVSIERQIPQSDGTIQSEVVAQGLITPFTQKLEVGSYVLVAHAVDEYAEVRYPLVIPYQNDGMEVSFPRPRNSQIPPGFVYIPEGRFFYGYGSRLEDEQLRIWYVTVPVHQRTLPAYLISRYETTYREWLEFLRQTCARPGCTDQPDLVPDGKYDAVRIYLEYTDQGKWRFNYALRDTVYSALQGQMFTYDGRTGALREQDWLDFPVSAFKPSVTDRYLAWLRDSGRVPRARLCTEYEWERAARGADLRTFPHGDILEPAAANFDITHGDNARGAGPDAVGTHPLSVSPFGVHDMAGNVWEQTASPYEPETTMIRGGAFYLDSPAAKSVNRWRPVAEASPIIGLRVCADFRAP